jgi:transposase-like protein
MDSARRGSPAEARRLWELAIDLWSNSGLSVAAFCRREGLKESSFYAWQQRLRKEDRTSEAITTLATMESTSARPETEPIAQQSRRRRKRLCQSTGDGSLAPVRLVEDAEPIAANVANTSRPSPPIEILLPRGTLIRVEHGCDSALLQRVLAVLESPPC